MQLRYHALNPQIETIRCVLAYRSYVANKNVSHIGLGVAALNTSQVLRSRGIWCDVWPVKDESDIETRINAAQADAAATGKIPISHVVISAPWIFSPFISMLVSRFTDIHFASISHSNVGFLGADPKSMRTLREYLDIQRQWVNFDVAANSRRFTSWINRAYGMHLIYLPNLYSLRDSKDVRPSYRGGVLRIGSFGAVRTLKNHVTAAAAALEISTRMGVDTEFWMNAGRVEGGSHANAIPETITAMFKGVHNATFKQAPWTSWAEFRNLIRNMNLLLQPSFTESFNMVTADGIAEGVPSVVSEAIEWVPEYWHASPDNALDIANKGVALLNDPVAASEGRQALVRHNQQGVSAWLEFLMPQIQPILAS